MKIKLLLALTNDDYAEHLSRVLSTKYEDTFDVFTCTFADRLQDMLGKNRFDAVILEPSFLSVESVRSVPLVLLLNDGQNMFAAAPEGVRQVRKYQRISSLAGTVLECCAELGSRAGAFRTDRARITAVWSPCGGVGKTSVALAYAARMVTEGKQATYLNLENFSSTSCYFPAGGKSISAVFEKLDSDVSMYLKGIRQQDSGSGIYYFCSPENYDDMNILSAGDLETLITACASESGEVVVDLSSQCDERIQKVFELADTILLVCDPSSASQAKLHQFLNQNNVFRNLFDKFVLVGNKGAAYTPAELQRSVRLPLVPAADAIAVYKTLSGIPFNW